MNSRVRVLVVLAILIGAHLMALPDVGRIFGLGEGDYGFSSDGQVITRVDPGEAADRAGLRPGDRISIDDRSETAQYMLMRGLGYRPGSHLLVHVRRGANIQNVTLVAALESGFIRAFVALRFLLAALTIGVATAFLLTRPSPASWGFFLYCLGVISLPGSLTSIYGSPLYRSIVAGMAYAAHVAALFGGVLFAWTFGNQRWTPWRTGVLAVCAALGVAAFAQTLLQLFPTRETDAYTAYSYLTIALMLAGFIDALLHEADGPSRQRLKWIIAAFAITIPCYYAQGFFPEYISYGTYVALIAAQAILPLCAAYAMFRKRVVDVRFVISRTFVYGAITALIAGGFSVLDEMLARSYDASRWGIVVDIAIAVAIGFSLDAMRERVDNAIDIVLFRDRHRAETRLRNAAAAIAHASDLRVVDTSLTELPVELLRLGGAALYTRHDGEAYRRRSVAGGAGNFAERIDSNDLLVLAMQASRETVSLDHVARSALQGRDAALAVPLLVRGDLTGFCVYGAHTNGLTIDAEERELLALLAHNASIAFDHAEAQALRERVAVLEARLKVITAIP